MLLEKRRAVVAPSEGLYGATPLTQDGSFSKRTANKKSYTFAPKFDKNAVFCYNYRGERERIFIFS